MFASLWSTENEVVIMFFLSLQGTVWTSFHYVLSFSAGYNADIICLQEVDRKVFENELLPSLDLLGYTGSCKVKGQQGCEGVAMFIHGQKFRYRYHF